MVDKMGVKQGGCAPKLMNLDSPQHGDWQSVQKLKDQQQSKSACWLACFSWEPVGLFGGKAGRAEVGGCVVLEIYKQVLRRSCNEAFVAGNLQDDQK